MKDVFNIIGQFIKKLYSISIMLCLFAGGMTFVGYFAALFIGGDAAEQICIFVYKAIVPIIIYTSSATVLLGLLSMYFCNEKTLSVEKDKKR